MRKVQITRPDLVRMIEDLKLDIGDMDKVRMRKRKLLISLEAKLRYNDSAKKREQHEREGAGWLSRPLLYPKKNNLLHIDKP